MKITVDVQMFHDRFVDFGRETNFTYEAREALFNYIEQMEESTGYESEFDVIGLCCDYSQEHWEDVCDNYSLIGDSQETIFEKLSDCTDAIESFDDGTILYLAY